MTIFVFVVVLTLSFVVVMYFTRPTAGQKRVEQRLTDIAGATPPLAEETTDLMKVTHYSDIPFLNAIFNRMALARHLQQLISQAGSKWTVGTLLAATIVMPAVVFWLGSFWMPIFAMRLVLAGLAGAVPYMTVRLQRSRRFRKFERVLPEAMDLMTRALKAGHSV